MSMKLMKGTAVADDPRELSAAAVDQFACGFHWLVLAALATVIVVAVVIYYVARGKARGRQLTDDSTRSDTVM